MVEVDVSIVRDEAIGTSIGDEEIHDLLAHGLEDVATTDVTWQFGVLLTNDARIRVMHDDFMGIDSATDIMTFPYEFDDVVVSGPQVSGGDMVISVETATANAVDAGCMCLDGTTPRTKSGVQCWISRINCWHPGVGSLDSLRNPSTGNG
jgi:ssRNA-specific RNase YbeY (16S rRNA maturation enzyme)